MPNVLKPDILLVTTVDETVELRDIRKKNVTWRECIHGEHAAGGVSHHYLTNRRKKYIWFSQNDPHYASGVAYWLEQWFGSWTGGRKDIQTGELENVDK